MHDTKGTVAEAQAPPDPFENHRLDLHAIDNGRWVEIRGDRFLVAHLGSAATAKTRADAMAELGLAPDAKVPAHQEGRISRHMFVHGILLDIQFANGTPCTLKHREQVFDDPELAETRGEILKASAGDYRKVAVAKAALLGN